jgi:asparagine synthase (glutamine-hydrolysing)
LGHARLGVIDLETGDQPMANEDGSVQVIFNGEIYNFRTLRAQLEGRGHEFRTRSDTEVLVHGWEEWGEALPERIDGMFALAVWDEARASLFLARDRAGKKPLFLTRNGGRLLFASEMKALEAGGARLDPAAEALPFYLAYGYVPGAATFVREVEKLPPAHALLVGSDGGERMWRYWRLEWRSGEGKAESAPGDVRTLLKSAVERRLVADVPLGAFLSGGIDSSIVVGLMSELTREPVRTFSLGFADDPEYDETSFARLAARRFGTRHTEFTVEAHHVELLDDLVAAYDEPFGDSSAIPTYLVSRLTREHVTVALTGDGGDEAFAGYARFLGAVLAERVPRPVVSIGRALSRALPYPSNFRHPLRRARRFFEAAALPAEERTLRWVGYLRGHVDALVRRDVLDRVDVDSLLEPLRRPLREHDGGGSAGASGRPSALARQLALNFETYLPEDLLVKADRCSMAHGLELRSPFLDTELLRFAASLPDCRRIRRGRLKVLLKDAFADLLPDEIRTRGKMGFGVPLPLWLRTRWRGVFEERVLDPSAPLWRWLRPEPVRDLWREHQERRADHGHALWALLTLSTWLERRWR